MKFDLQKATTGGAVKNRAFTLIELLAVIVILAVIALISTPIILNIVNKARRSAFLDSSYGIMESAKLYYTESMLDGGLSTDKTFLFEGDIPEGLNYSGTSPKGGMLILGADGSISMALYDGNYCASKGKTDRNITLSDYKEGSCIIPDSMKNPVITLKGEKEVLLFVGDIYTEEGATAKTVDGTELTYTTEIKLNDTIVESIDTSSVNTYIITYTAESNGKKASETRKVIITIENADKSGANKPELNGLVPIKWNGSNWIVADKENTVGENQWYDYNTQMWANGASVTEEYRNAAVGTVVPEEAVLAYFVWIPRYEYMYTNLGDNYAGGTAEQPGEIKVNFIGKNIATASSSDYKVHPAFTFGDKELSGFWTGKFETTGDANTPTIKPNLVSLRKQKVNEQFSTSKLFTSGNSYGINSSADAHMMKNSEWGAVAYLSQSKYGKYGNNSYTGLNKEIYINNDPCIMTGATDGTINGTAANCNLYSYEKEGIGASTTGNIYGIYDMSGGLLDRVMGYLIVASSEWGATNNANYAGFLSKPAAKYYDEYKTTDVTTACNNGICYGHALNETNGWYNDGADFISLTNPWMMRGGMFAEEGKAGVFNFNFCNGASDSAISFRVVLSAQ